MSEKIIHLYTPAQQWHNDEWKEIPRWGITYGYLVTYKNIPASHKTMLTFKYCFNQIACI